MNDRCEPTHKREPLSGHVFDIKDYNNFPKRESDEDKFVLECVKCSFSTVSDKPLRKAISPSDDHEHDWHTLRFPLKSAYAFCYHCEATKACTERLDANAHGGNECDYCGPSEFSFAQSWLTFPVQRAYSCSKCLRMVSRFTWHPNDCPKLHDDSEFLVIPSEEVSKILNNPDEKKRILELASKNWRYGGRRCDGCGIVEADAKIFEDGSTTICIHEEDPKSMRYVKSSINHKGKIVNIYMDYCVGCRERDGFEGYRVLIASSESYENNDRIASALTNML